MGQKEKSGFIARRILLSLHRTNIERKRICKSKAKTGTLASLHCLPPPPPACSTNFNGLNFNYSVIELEGCQLHFIELSLLDRLRHIISSNSRFPDTMYNCDMWKYTKVFHSVQVRDTVCALWKTSAQKWKIIVFHQRLVHSLNSYHSQRFSRFEN